MCNRAFLTRARHALLIPADATTYNWRVDLPGIAPMLSYEDPSAAATWLCEQFGFEDLGRFADGGRVTHVNLRAGDGIIMIGWPGPEYRSPRHHAEICEVARSWLASPFVIDGVYVRVDDVDAHYARAREGGAKLLSGIEINEIVGQRQYRVEDVEGHRWMFAQPL